MEFRPSVRKVAKQLIDPGNSKTQPSNIYVAVHQDYCTFNITWKNVNILQKKTHTFFTMITDLPLKLT